MEVNINGEVFNLIIEAKNNKNLYIRVKKDLNIYVTCPFLTSKKRILNLIEDNKSSILKMINREKKKLEKSNYFFLLGKKYDIVVCASAKKPSIEGDKVFVKRLEDLTKLGRKYANIIFNERLEHCYSLFEEKFDYPSLIIRVMRRKWGHCNKIEKVITLNLDLIKYDINEIDYVIIHELSHFVHFNHSPEFWHVVGKYKPDYKKSRKILREE